MSFEQKSAGDDELNAEMNTLIGMHATYETADREAKLMILFGLIPRQPLIMRPLIYGAGKLSYTNRC